MFFVDAIKQTGFSPRLLRTDAGTENGIMAGIQCYIADNIDAHRYGTSPSNQRVENWWSHFRRGYSSWVINHFKEMVDTGDLILGSHTHMECIWFVYSSFIQCELDRIKTEWNAHYIRRSQHTSVPGIPNELYFLPTASGGVQCGRVITDSFIQNITSQRDVYSEAETAIKKDENLETYFRYVILHEGLRHPPRTWTEANETLLNTIKDLCSFLKISVPHFKDLCSSL